MIRDFWQTSGDRMPAMDGVRGLAVLIVFLSHSSGRGQALAPFLQFQGIGQVGVYLFFVLSGYLLADNLLREQEKCGSISVQGFLIRRFFRIAPLYYFVLTAVFVQQLYTGIIYKNFLHINGGVVGYFEHLLFYKGDGVFWTLPTEFMFYFVLPFFVLALVRLGKMAVYGLVVFSVAYFLWFLLILVGVVPTNLALRMVKISHNSQYLDVFVPGVLAAYFQRTEFFQALVKNNAQHMDRLGLLVLTACIFVTFAMVGQAFVGFTQPAYGLRWLSLPYGIVFAFIILCVKANGRVRQCFELPLLKFMGIVGFSWYLTHFAVFMLVNELSSEPFLRFILSFGICAIVAFVLFILIEKPFMQYGRQIASSRREILSISR